MLQDEPAPEPTHYSLLDLKTMKVQEIRDELLARNLPDKGNSFFQMQNFIFGKLLKIFFSFQGVRNVVMARLAKALNTEKAEEAKNKRKTNKPQTSPQKTTPAKTSNETAKKDEEKMEVDTDTATKEVEKKSTEDSKKKPEKKEDNEDKSKAKTPADKKNVTKGKSDKEDQEDWADVIDFELSDIVILDEYDSSKNSEVILCVCMR